MGCREDLSISPNDCLEDFPGKYNQLVDTLCAALDDSSGLTVTPETSACKWTLTSTSGAGNESSAEIVDQSNLISGVSTFPAQYSLTHTSACGSQQTVTLTDSTDLSITDPVGGCDIEEGGYRTQSIILTKPTGGSVSDNILVPRFHFVPAGFQSYSNANVIIQSIDNVDTEATITLSTPPTGAVAVLVKLTIDGSNATFSVRKDSNEAYAIKHTGTAGQITDATFIVWLSSTGDFDWQLSETVTSGTIELLGYYVDVEKLYDVASPCTDLSILTPGISITKTADLSGLSETPMVGDTINYAFEIENTGNVTLTDITVIDPTATVTGGQIDLAGGGVDTTTFTATYDLDQQDIDNAATVPITNTATVTATYQATGDTTANSNTVSFDISGP